MSEGDAWVAEVSAAVGRARDGVAWLDRVVVLDEVGSTQDAARDLSGGRPGLVLIAKRQTSGRGRLGRSWAPTAGLGLAATFVLDAGAYGGGGLSIRAGLGACFAVEAALGVAPREAGTPRLDWLDWFLSPGISSIVDAADLIRGRGQGHVGLRWPNDVVRLDRDGRPEAKIAGVLIERTGGVFLVGIGVNVGQTDADWPEELKDRAASLRQMGVARSVAETAAALVLGLNVALGLDEGGVRAAWAARDSLHGRRCLFESGGVRYQGRVQRVEPESGIELMDERRGPVRLAAETTSLLSAE